MWQNTCLFWYKFKIRSYYDSNEIAKGTLETLLRFSHNLHCESSGVESLQIVATYNSTKQLIRWQSLHLVTFFKQQEAILCLVSRTTVDSVTIFTTCYIFKQQDAILYLVQPCLWNPRGLFFEPRAGHPGCCFKRTDQCKYVTPTTTSHQTGFKLPDRDVVTIS